MLSQSSGNLLCHFFNYTFTYLHFSTHVLEYSLVIASVVSIGHISTTALAAISLGSMTASVSAFSIIQGLTSALDTLLPSAWTSSQPQLVGLWTQRMCKPSKNFLQLFFCHSQRTIQMW